MRGYATQARPDSLPVCIRIVMTLDLTLQIVPEP